MSTTKRSRSGAARRRAIPVGQLCRFFLFRREGARVGVERGDRSGGNLGGGSAMAWGQLPPRPPWRGRLYTGTGPAGQPLAAALMSPAPPRGAAAPSREHHRSALPTAAASTGAPGGTPPRTPVHRQLSATATISWPSIGGRGASARRAAGGNADDPRRPRGVAPFAPFPPVPEPAVTAGTGDDATHLCRSRFGRSGHLLFGYFATALWPSTGV